MKVTPVAAQPLPTAPAPSRPKAAPTAHGTTFDLHQGITLDFLQKALTTRIGKAVEDKLGAQGINVQDVVGVDFSAEATAQRIVSFTTGMLGVFAAQNPDLPKDQLIDRFEQTIRGGIKQGYHEALAILDTMASFDNKVRGLGQQTMQLVDKKLDAYFAKLRQSQSQGQTQGTT